MQAIARNASILCAAGCSAALAAHAALQGIAVLGAGAASFETHPHVAFAPAIVVELAIIVALLSLAVREYRASSPTIAREAREALGGKRAILFALGVGAIATATLFGMEVSESATAATGLGWLGGSFFPGAPVLALMVLAATAVLKAMFDGRRAGLEHLVRLLSKIFVAIAHAGRPAPSARVRTAPRPIVVCSAFGRSTGLRAPPLSPA